MTSLTLLCSIRGVDCVEVDAARTSDGHLVVMHVSCIGGSWGGSALGPLLESGPVFSQVRELQQLLGMAGLEAKQRLLAGREASKVQVRFLSLDQYTSSGSSHIHIPHNTSHLDPSHTHDLHMGV